MVKIYKETLQSIIDELKNESDNLRISADKLSRFNDIEGKGDVYESLHNATAEASYIGGAASVMALLISQNLQKIHDDVDNQDKMLSQEIAKEKKE